MTRWLWTPDLAERYNRSPRQIKRWRDTGKIPAGTIMPNGREAWTDTQIEEHEKSLVGGGEAAVGVEAAE